MEAGIVNKMFASIAGRYDLTNTVLSFGIHKIWRYKLVRMLPRSSDKLVMDLCTGTGDLLPILKKRFGKVIGVDFCLPMLNEAYRKELNTKHSESLIQGDALALPFADETFDIVSVAFGVRNFENLEKGLREIRRVLKKDGKLLVLEFGQPKVSFIARFYSFYSKHIMPLIGGVLTGNRSAYVYLPNTAASFPCREEFLSILASCGFCNSRYKTMSFGIAYGYAAGK